MAVCKPAATGGRFILTRCPVPVVQTGVFFYWSC